MTFRLDGKARESLSDCSPRPKFRCHSGRGRRQGEHDTEAGQEWRVEKRMRGFFIAP